MAHYPTLEDDKQLEGNADAYYGYQAYHQARGEGIKTGNEECFKKSGFTHQAAQIHHQKRRRWHPYRNNPPRK